MKGHIRWNILNFLKKRPTIQTLSLVLSNAYFLSFLRFIPCGYLQCSNCIASTFSCPLIIIERGAVFASMGIFSGLFGTAMITKILGTVVAAFAILLFFGALFGSWGCGWLCPFGFIQDLLAKIPFKKIRIPLFVFLVILIPYLTRRLFFCEICPSGTINRLWQDVAGIPLFFKTPQGIWALISIAFLFVIVVLSVLSYRPFCKLFCPIGGVIGLMNKLSGIYIRVDKDKCVSCSRCERLCSLGINPSLQPAHSECSRCLECTKACKHISLDLRL